MTKRVDRAANRRERILDAATLLFEKKGFAATGVAEIADMAGVAIGQMYRDFRSKDDIIIIVAARICDQFTDKKAVEVAIRNRDKKATWEWIHNLIGKSSAVRPDSLMTEIIAQSARVNNLKDIFSMFLSETQSYLQDALAVVDASSRCARWRKSQADKMMVIVCGTLSCRVASVLSIETIYPDVEFQYSLSFNMEN